MAEAIKKKRGYTIVKKHTIVYEWMINEISSYIKSSYTAKRSISLYSPEFCTDSGVKDSWRLHLKFNSPQSSGNKDYISIFLRSLNSNRVIKTKVVHFILNKKREKVLIQKHSQEFEIEQSLGYQKFLKKSELLEKKDVLIPYDTLTLGVELSVFDDYWTISTSAPFNESKRLMTCDYEELYRSKTGTDISLIVQGKKFEAHKLILMVRSPVFHAMLTTEMRDKITIQDVKPEIFSHVLEFIYTDKVTGLNDIAEDLLTAADKYQIQTLKQMCVESLCLSLNIENAAKLLLLADRHKAKLMLKYVAEFMTINAENVTQTEEYKSMESIKPDLALSVFKNFSALKINDK
ncbi:speckle-type POZ protein B [Microplitis demolitor]|uniref:speckle-type POZ protein B n=1 Tax=Microplitis demolitor TaxID=69319 RepID=UPI0004CD2D27|nr:speckle-type POZ protein B [Microplitis demolitor]XP_053598187.1 speckle-type POZ protein B [Microplitis demolitor]